MKYLITLTFLSFLTCFYFYTKHEKEAEINVMNSKRIQIGQTKKEVFNIMGESYEERMSKDSTGKIERDLYYITPFGTSNNIRFTLDVRYDTVKEIELLKE